MGEEQPHDTDKKALVDKLEADFADPREASGIPEQEKVSHGDEISSEERAATQKGLSELDVVAAAEKSLADGELATDGVPVEEASTEDTGGAKYPLAPTEGSGAVLGAEAGDSPIFKEVEKALGTPNLNNEEPASYPEARPDSAGKLNASEAVPENVSRIVSAPRPSAEENPVLHKEWGKPNPEKLEKGPLLSGDIATPDMDTTADGTKEEPLSPDEEDSIDEVEGLLTEHLPEEDEHPKEDE